jgi:hypothetical protein
MQSVLVFSGRLQTGRGGGAYVLLTDDVEKRPA